MISKSNMQQNGSIPPTHTHTHHTYDALEKETVSSSKIPSAHTQKPHKNLFNLYVNATN